VLYSQKEKHTVYERCASSFPI